MSGHIQSQFLSTGLRKALNEECNERVRHYVSKIEKDPLLAPAEKQGWRRGSFSYWHVNAVIYWTERLFWELEEMATKKGGKSGKPTPSLADYSFVRCELTSEDKKAAKIWIDSNMLDFGAILHDVVASDYKFSVSFSSEHDTFTASLTGKPDAINAFKTLTARHADWTIAAMTVLYKNAVMFKSGVWESEDVADDGWA